MRRTLRALSVSAVLALAAQAAHADPGDWGGLLVTGTVTSNYIFRGISNSANHPAFQGSIEYDHSSGLYAGVWASSIDFNDNDKTPAEVDFYGGYRFAVEKWSFDAGVMYYSYPETLTDAYRFWEFYGKVSRPLTDTLSWNAQAIYSPDFYGKTGTGVYLQTGLINQFTPWLTADANIGEQWADKLDNSTFGFPYMNWNVGATATWKQLAFDLRYLQSDLNDDQCAAFTGNHNWCGAVVVATVTLKLP